MKELTKEQKEFAIWLHNHLALRCRCISDKCKYCNTKNTLKEIIEETFNVSYK